MLGVCNGIFTTQLSIYSAMRLRKEVAIQQSADICARILIGILLVVLWKHNGMAPLLGYFSGGLLVIVFQYAKLGNYDLLWHLPIGLSRTDHSRMTHAVKELWQYA